MTSQETMKPLPTMKAAWAEYKRLRAESDRLGTESDRLLAESDRLWTEGEQVVRLTAEALHGKDARIDWKKRKVVKAQGQ